MSTTTEKAPSTKVVTSLVRFSYAHVFEPQAIEEGQEKKYSVALIISKSDKALVAKINAAIAAATEAGKNTKFNGKIPKKLKTPLRDGDEERPDDPAYENAYFLNASCKTKPGVVDKDLNPIMDQDDFYSGCYGRASINFFAFNTAGNMGIAAGLNNLQKMKDGERLSARVSAEADFGEALDEEEDDLL